jgi:hypothetical protein
MKRAVRRSSVLRFVRERISALNYELDNGGVSERREEQLRGGLVELEALEERLAKLPSFSIGLRLGPDFRAKAGRG